MLSLEAKQGQSTGLVAFKYLEAEVLASSRAIVDSSGSKNCYFGTFSWNIDFISSCGSVAVNGLGGAALGTAVAIFCAHLCEADGT